MAVDYRALCIHSPSAFTAVRALTGLHNRNMCSTYCRILPDADSSLSIGKAEELWDLWIWQDFPDELIEDGFYRVVITKVVVPVHLPLPGSW